LPIIAATLNISQSPTVCLLTRQNPDRHSETAQASALPFL
jgi:hypothetical protein